MNERIKQFYKQAGLDDDICPIDQWENPEVETFVKLILDDVANRCVQEWYALNNAPRDPNADKRAIGIRVGQKNGVLKCIAVVKNYYES